MKKEGLVFILFLIVIFLAGCTQREQDIDFSKSQALIDWSESFPGYYSSEDIDSQFQNYIDSALKNNDIKGCEQILLVEGGKGTARDDAFHQCFELLTKKKAFSQKDITGCDKLYEPENNLVYEECVAPIAAYLAIVNEDKNRCDVNLDDKELIKICEDDYERFN